MAATAIMVFAFMLPVLCYLSRACCEVPACQLSLISDDIWPSYSDLSEFKMAAAAILVFLFILPLLWIDRACGTAPTCQISSRTDDI